MSELCRNMRRVYDNFRASASRFLVYIAFRMGRNASPSISHYLPSISGSDIEQDPKHLAGNSWDKRRVEISAEFNTHPTDFLRQTVISRALHPNQQQLAQDYLDDLRKHSFAQENILCRLHDIPIGDPFLCKDFPFASPLSMQHAYYLFLIREHLNLFIPEGNLDSIVELGGGYGNMCRLIYSFGYTSSYVIVDFPEMHAIQRHFICHALPDHQSSKIKFLSLDGFHQLNVTKTSLFMATFSLSEMPVHKRNSVEGLLKNFDYIFMTFNRQFDSVNNIFYFENLAERLGTHFQIEMLQDKHRSAWFLLGRRRERGRLH